MIFPELLLITINKTHIHIYNIYNTHFDDHGNYYLKNKPYTHEQYSPRYPHIHMNTMPICFCIILFAYFTFRGRNLLDISWFTDHSTMFGMRYMDYVQEPIRSLRKTSKYIKYYIMYSIVNTDNGLFIL